MFTVHRFSLFSAKMHFYVVIQPDYPCSVPVFAVWVSWNNERSSLTDEHIRVGIFFSKGLVHTG